jgi:hypothetical protein
MSVDNRCYMEYMRLLTFKLDWSEFWFHLFRVSHITRLFESTWKTCTILKPTDKSVVCGNGNAILIRRIQYIAFGMMIKPVTKWVRLAVKGSSELGRACCWRVTVRPTSDLQVTFISKMSISRCPFAGHVGNPEPGNDRFLREIS